MSFSISFTGRSRAHALQLLEERAKQVPASVYSFLRTAIENIGPAAGHELRAIEVAANGHLAEDASAYLVSNASFSVKPLFVAD